MRLLVRMVTGVRRGAHGADLGDAHLVFAQVLEQEGLEGLVGAVHLVDQQHGAGLGRLQRLQQRPADQVAVLVDLALDLASRAAPAAFGRAHVQQLRRVVPFVQRLALLQAVVALQPQQLALQRVASALASSVLPTPGSPSSSSGRCSLSARNTAVGQAPVGEIADRLQRLRRGVDGGGAGRRHAIIPGPCATARCVMHADQVGAVRRRRVQIAVTGRWHRSSPRPRPPA